MAAEDEKGWFYLTPDGQNHGPFNVDAMKELFNGKYINEDALVWAPGESDWLPLKASHELYAALAFQDDDKKKGAVDADLAAFNAEIAAIESNDVVPQVDSPPPEEREFEDDDGTVFVWDSALRKFKPRGLEVPVAAAAELAGEATGAPSGAAAALEYTPDMMVFEREEEVIPTLQEAREAEAASLALAEQLAEGKGPPGGGKGSKAGGRGVAAGGGGAVAVGGAATALGRDATSEPEAGVGRPDDGAGGESAKRSAGASGDAPDAKKGRAEEPAFFQPKNNTNVYVTGLPDDVTVAEVAEVFGRCGIIKPGDNDEPRIKLYRDKKTDMLKGDCLISYLQVPSVNLAIKIMDGRQFRPGEGRPMSVQEAKFEQKGDYVAKKKQLNKSDKKKLQAKKEKLLNWGGFDDKAKPEEVTVVLYGMFTLEELLLNPDLEEQLVQDVLEQGKRFGAIDLVKAFNKNPDGVMWIKFRLPEAAQACLGAMNGRFYAGRQIRAELWDGKKNFNTKPKESVEEEAARLDAFAKELEQKE